MVDGLGARQLPVGCGLFMTMMAVQEAGDALRDLIKGDLKSPPEIRKVAFRLPGQRTGSRDFVTHWLHRYPAKMFHRIPRIILEQISGRGALTVLDPFCGSGTVLLESILLGHRAIGIDVNPLARLISRVKTTAISPSHLQEHLPAIRNRLTRMTVEPGKDDALDFWFKRKVRTQLQCLAASVNGIEHKQCRDFFSLCVSSCVRPCSWADPTIAPPVRLHSERIPIAGERYKANYRHARGLKADDVLKEFEKVTSENLRRMKELFEYKTLGKAEVLSSSYHASETGLRDGSIDLVLTSPPYCGAQKYVRSLRLEMLVLGISPKIIAEADKRTLGTERVPSTGVGQWDGSTNSRVARLIRKVNERNSIRGFMLSEYLKYLKEFAREIRRVLKPGGEAFVTFGSDHVSGICVDTAALFAEMAIEHSLYHVGTLIDTIPSRGMMTIRHSSANTITDERVVWLRRVESND